MTQMMIHKTKFFTYSNSQGSEMKGMYLENHQIFKIKNSTNLTSGFRV